MDDALNVLLQRLELDPPLFHADEFRRGLVEWRQQMETAGVLKQIAASVSATCPYCCYDSVRRVTFLDDRRTGGKRGYISCPECGLIEVPPERLQRWIVDVPGILHAAFSGDGTTVRPLESVEGRLWHVGKAMWAGRSREVWFARAFRSAHADEFTKPLLTRPKAIVFAPTEVGAERWKAATENLVISLESTLALVDGTLQFDSEYVEGRIIEAGMGADAVPKQPVKRRSDRAAKIEMLTKEMIEHLREARDHAFATMDRTGQPELLPRPTQSELGKRVGLTKWDVSRCFSDSRARELRLYWEAADRLDQVMAWRGPAKRGRAS